MLVNCCFRSMDPLHGPSMLLWLVRLTCSLSLSVCSSQSFEDIDAWRNWHLSPFVHVPFEKNLHRRVVEENLSAKKEFPAGAAAPLLLPPLPWPPPSEFFLSLVVSESLLIRYRKLSSFIHSAELESLYNDRLMMFTILPNVLANITNNPSAPPNN